MTLPLFRKEGVIMTLKAADFKMPEDLERYRLAVREFVQKELDPYSEKLEGMTSTPKELMDMLREAGLLKLTAPKEYGGWGLTITQYWPILEEVAKGQGAIRLIVHAWNGVFMRSILEYGTEEMKREYMPRIARGEWNCAFALTEPGTGTGMDIKSTAARDGDNYILNGRKHLISLADICDGFNVLVWTDRSAGRKGLTSFLLEKGTPGFTVVSMPPAMGNRGSFHGELIYKDCAVSAKKVLGQVGQGIDVMLGLLDLSRLSIAVSCLGLAQRFLEISVPYTQTRVTFSKPIAERQAVQQMLADMVTNIYALRMIVNDAVQKAEQGLDIRTEASMCKLFGIETLRCVSDIALNIHAGLGYFKTFPIERMYRDSRALWFEEGTPTIQRLVIARDVLKSYSG